MALSAPNHGLVVLTDQQIREYAVAASTTIYKGGLVGLKTDGYARAYTTADFPVGFAYEGAVEATAVDGAAKVRVYTQGDFDLTISGAVIGDLGKLVYASDDGTFTLTPVGVPFGYIVSFDTAGKAIVRLCIPSPTPGNVFHVMGVVNCVATTSVIILPATFNRNGLTLRSIHGVVSTVMAGSSEDQGVVTLYDSADASSSLTLTAADGGAAVGTSCAKAGAYDLISMTGGTNDPVIEAADVGLYVKSTQLTSGGTPTGAIRVFAEIALH